MEIQLNATAQYHIRKNTMPLLKNSSQQNKQRRKALQFLSQSDFVNSKQIEVIFQTNKIKRNQNFTKLQDENTFNNLILLLKTQPDQRNSQDLSFIFDCLKEFEFFKNLNSKGQDFNLIIPENFCQYLYLKQFKKNEVLIDNRKEIKGLYLLLKGKVIKQKQMIKDTNNWKKSFAQIGSQAQELELGDQIGEESLIKGQQLLENIYICKTNTFFAYLDISFYDLINRKARIRKLYKDFSYFYDLKSINSNVNEEIGLILFKISSQVTYKKGEAVCQENGNFIYFVQYGKFSMLSKLYQEKEVAQKVELDSRELKIKDNDSLVNIGICYLQRHSYFGNEFFQKKQVYYQVVCESQTGLIYKINIEELYNKLEKYQDIYNNFRKQATERGEWIIQQISKILQVKTLQKKEQKVSLQFHIYKQDSPNIKNDDKNRLMKYEMNNFHLKNALCKKVFIDKFGNQKKCYQFVKSKISLDEFLDQFYGPSGQAPLIQTTEYRQIKGINDRISQLKKYYNLNKLESKNQGGQNNKSKLAKLATCFKILNAGSFQFQSVKHQRDSLLMNENIIALFANNFHSLKNKTIKTNQKQTFIQPQQSNKLTKISSQNSFHSEDNEENEFKEINLIPSAYQKQNQGFDSHVQQNYKFIPSQIRTQFYFLKQNKKSPDNIQDYSLNVLKYQTHKSENNIDNQLCSNNNVEINKIIEAQKSKYKTKYSLTGYNNFKNELSAIKTQSYIEMPEKEKSLIKQKFKKQNYDEIRKIINKNKYSTAQKQELHIILGKLEQHLQKVKKRAEKKKKINRMSFISQSKDQLNVLENQDKNKIFNNGKRIHNKKNILSSMVIFDSHFQKNLINQRKQQIFVGESIISHFHSTKNKYFNKRFIH